MTLRADSTVVRSGRVASGSVRRLAAVAVVASAALAGSGCAGASASGSGRGTLPVGSVFVDAVDRNAGSDAERGDAFSDGVDGISTDTRFEIVADQLEPEPAVEVEGTDVRLVFDGGAVENAFIDCVVVEFARVGTETVTLVYPNGEQRC